MSLTQFLNEYWFFLYVFMGFNIYIFYKYEAYCIL